MRQCAEAPPPLYSRKDTLLLADGQRARCWLHHADAPRGSGINQPEKAEVA